METIIVVLTIILLVFLRDKVVKHIGKLISLCNSAEMAVKYRRNLKLFGVVWTGLFIANLAALLYTINSDISYWTDGYGKPVFVLLVSTLLYKQGYKLLIGNVSSYTITKYLKKKKHYVLLLRGFEDDDYDVSMPKDYESPSFTKFNENSFSYVAEPYFNICAVGMTKEVYAPFGGDRIYVDDETWKEDVELLMDKASFILVLMNNRDSCIWEIVQCKDKLEKTIFFVTDLYKYNSIRFKINGIIDFPDIKESDETQSYYIEFRRDKDNKIAASVIHMEHSEEEYKLFIEYLIAIKGVYKKPSPWIKVIKWLGLLFITIALSPLLISSYDAFMSFLNIDSVFLQILVVGVLLLFGWVIYMLVKVSIIQRRSN